MRIATWNVNSVRARLPLVSAFLEKHQPDVLVLQEIKGEDDTFPRAAFEGQGYHAEVFGQKAYNGVAILSREKPYNVLRGLPGDPPDTQARYLEVTIGGVRIASLYVPNGNPLDSEKYTFKLAWMDRLTARARVLLATEEPVLLAGDFNVIPTAKDVDDPSGWEHDALYAPPVRAAFRALVNLGYTDALRTLHPDDPRLFTFWDYKARSWERDAGIRIDHVLLSPEAADRLTEAHVDRAWRDEPQASDHAPVIVELSCWALR